MTGTFKIVASSQNPLSIVTDKPTDVYYSDSFRLCAMGGSGSGAIHWSIEQTGNIASIDSNGVVTVNGVGGFTVKAYREASGGYSASNTARETVQNSIVRDGVLHIPLSGSATVEIVDNSKEYDDVPPESWAADTVDFASSHELFNGTSGTTFSPDQAMSRGMLATVLYRLEGQPDQDQLATFSDVDRDAWYADGVSWAAENGIAGGYGDGRFGPDDNITREQFVVMLWRYAETPEVSSQALDFVDTDQVGSYAQEALCWAVETGILHGEGNGVLNPQGKATRAEVAQLLKNFLENT